MLHLSRVAYGCENLEVLQETVAQRAANGQLRLTTRYLPKRHAEILAGGSLFWIVRHRLVARAPVLAFEDDGAGRINIVLHSSLSLVEPFPRRAHQGWRYLQPADAPPDIAGTGIGAGALPAGLLTELSGLGLI